MDSSEGASEGTASRDQDMDAMIELMKKKRSYQASMAGKLKLKKKQALPSLEAGLKDQLCVFVGKMHHCAKRGKGIHESSSRMQRLLVKKDCTYSRMLGKCIEQLYGETSPSCSYYLSDSSGIDITGGNTEFLTIDDGGASGKQIPWTIETFLKVTGKSASKARFYCVKVGGSSKEDRKLSQEGHQTSSRTQVEQSSSEMEFAAEMTDQIVPIVKATKSRYRDTYSFRTEVRQEDAVGFGLNSSDPAERDIMMEVQDCITKHPDLECNAAFPYNPCNYGYCLCSIKKGDEILVDLVEDLDCDKGVVYKSNQEEFSVWRDAYVSNGIAVLICIAQGGFHTQVSYEWQRSKCLTSRWPITYEEVPGTYICTISGLNIMAKAIFYVEGLGTSLSVKMEDVILSETPAPTISERTEVVITGASPNGEPKWVNTYVKELISCKQCEDLEADFDDPKLLSVIGQGSFGTVHKALWRGMMVAAKVIPVSLMDGKEKASMEVELCQRIQHPNILQFLGVVFKETSITMLSNLVKGRNLYSLLFDPTYPEVEDHTMHTYLADFGLARIVSSTGTTGSKTTKCGTPGFQAPEQMRAAVVTCKVDVYAFGCVLVEVFGGRPLWGDLQPLQIMYKVGVEGRTPSMEHVPEEIRHLGHLCFAKEEERTTAINILKLLINIAKKS